MPDTHNFSDQESSLYTQAGFSATQAIVWQRKWAQKVSQEPFDVAINTVAGADVAFSPCEKYCIAAIVVMKMPDLTIVTTSEAVMPIQVPYIPGLLSFREAPAVLAAAGKLAVRPNVLILDGQGFAHPRRFGLACHVGVSLGWPTIGCAKSRLIGEYREPGLNKGCRRRLTDDHEVIGMVVRSRKGVKCLYVSIGHRVSLNQAVNLVLRCCTRFRLPEPTRLAHQRVTLLRNTSFDTGCPVDL
jgi:deoxyribonuclease V